MSRGDKAACAVVMNRTQVVKQTNLATTLMARDYKGYGNQLMTGVVELG